MTQSIEERFYDEKNGISGISCCPHHTDERVLAFIKQVVEEEREKAYKENIEKMGDAIVMSKAGWIDDAKKAERNRLKEEVEKMGGWGWKDNERKQFWLGNGKDCIYVERSEVLQLLQD